jgi:hypothetical protein
MSNKPLHPLAELALGVIGRVGERAATRFAQEGMEAMVDSVLEDVETMAEEVRARTKRARGRIAEKKRAR